MSKNNNIFVSPHDLGWQVKKANTNRATKVCNTQADAFEYARKLAIKNQSELSVQGKNGKIRDKRSYGNDPFPPKG
ncbi:hypothetical protein FNFX1_0645 [Francisella cf. novicida Fx1]|uniref:DUF2188 domain-containing protein n=1 Tax=Francisella tularensis TaxID=263 RepID=UPI0002058C5C|nr:DUF2188 domain-containing protein [Francisella tularensis]AEB27593.1 hypothetical protein FNFX1_0645 [Francisella cf. novicida Fx1]AJI72734.1 hypothetical protein AQ14_224 [Francisella tularensis subsp. novicida D9876]